MAEPGATSEVAGLLRLAAAPTPATAAQTFREKRLFFGDAHWHSCKGIEDVA
jgi:hypothetical protein